MMDEPESVATEIYCSLEPPPPEYTLPNPIANPPRLTYADLEGAAASLKCDMEVIVAIARQEGSSQGAFLDDGRPTLLYERHWFRRLMRQKDSNKARAIASEAPEVCGPARASDDYGGLTDQYDRLETAIGYDVDIALQSASWGHFQVMGVNWQYLSRFKKGTIRDFVAAMYASEKAQLDAHVDFVLYRKANKKVPAGHVPDFTGYARLYNGDADDDLVDQYANAFKSNYLTVKPIVKAVVALKKGAPTLGHSVGIQATNDHDDVALVKLMLKLTSDPNIAVNGRHDDALYQAIKTFQQKQIDQKKQEEEAAKQQQPSADGQPQSQTKKPAPPAKPDGVISPTGDTFKKLQNLARPLSNNPLLETLVLNLLVVQ
jgi:hypothetical protein